MAEAICSIEGCDRKRRARGWCEMHWTRWRKSGDVGPPGPLRISSYADTDTCLVEGCSRPPSSRQLCSSHYQRFVKHGDPVGGNRSPSVSKAVDHPDGTRTCSSCSVRQPLENYHRDNANATLGRRSQCKSCRIEHVKGWYADNRERQTERQRQRLVDNPELVREYDRKRYLRDREKRIATAMIAVDKRRARQAGVEYDRTVTRPNLRKQYGDSCFYCGVAMTFVVTPKGAGLARPDNLATLEHIVPICAGGPHTWENVVLACWRCNITKNKRELEDWMAEVNRES